MHQKVKERVHATDMSESSQPRLQVCSRMAASTGRVGSPSWPRCTGGENSTSHLSSEGVCVRKLDSYWKRTAFSLRIKWKKMGLPTLVRKNCGQNLDDHELGCLQLPSLLCWDGEPHRGGGMKNDPGVTRWKHKFGFHNRGGQWDTTVSKWAGEWKDWIQLVAQGLLRKAD